MKTFIHKVLLISATLLLLARYDAQAQLLKSFGNRLLNHAKERATQKAEGRVDNVVDSVTTGKGNHKKGDKSTQASENDNTIIDVPEKSYLTKFDFIPGEKILLNEDFASDAVGDFPTRWNTNSTGEIVTVDGMPGKWLMLSKDGVYLPELVTSLPENFTLQFDLITNRGFSYYSTEFNMIFAALKAQKEFSTLKKYNPNNKDAVNVWFHPLNAAGNAGHSGFIMWDKGSKGATNEANTGQFFAEKANGFIKVSVWRQNQRLRVYLNEEKIWDLPRAFTSGINYNSLVFMLGTFHSAADKYFVSNLKFAIGAPDTRNKLLKEGRFVTRGILFDVNSDVIKPQSYGVLKEIAGVLKDNPEIRVNIIGHTDSDGDGEANLELSKKRASAVKMFLNKSFGIDELRMHSDGKGETQPVDNNGTSQGKANNRRVEFIKL